MDPIESLLQPIPGEQPAGPNLRYDPIYAELKKAREEEDDTIPQGEWRRELKSADFGLARKLATQILTDRSKDLQVAAWLTEAWTRLEGVEGLDRGLLLLRRLMEEFWEGIHPEVEGGDLEFRAVPLEWVGRYLQTSVELVPLTQGGLGYLHYRDGRTIPSEAEAESDSAKARTRKEAVEAGRATQEDFQEGVEASSKAFYKTAVAGWKSAQQRLVELEALCDERFGDATPNLIPLRELLEAIQRIVAQQLARKLEVDPDPVDLEVEEDEGAGGAPTEAAGADGDDLPTEMSSPAHAHRLATEAARFLRRQQPSDPTPYLLLRGLGWGKLRGAAEPMEPKLLGAPPTPVRTRLRTLSLDGKWAELLDACEEAFAAPYGPGWLDLQRYVLEACEALGSEFDPVAKAVRGALLQLLQDLPGLIEATLMDDAPAANDQTRIWLRESLGVGSPEGATPAADADPIRAMDRKISRLRRTDPHHAIRLLIQEANRERSARARFLRRSQAAAIMVENGLESVALPILRELIEQIDRHQLESWEEGEVVARALSLLSAALQKIDGDSSERRDLYLRICRLDPLEAIRVGRS